MIDWFWKKRDDIVDGWKGIFPSRKKPVISIQCWCGNKYSVSLDQCPYCKVRRAA